MRKLGLMLGLGLAGVVYGSEVEILPEITRHNIEEQTSEDFSVVFIYSSNPTTTDSIAGMQRGEDIILDLNTKYGDYSRRFLRFDTQKLADELGSSSGVTSYLQENFEINKRPSILFFCNGNQVYKLNGSAPKSDEKIPQAKAYLGSKIIEFSNECK
ncbi:hypothetical protein ISS08_02535 [Candidatus Pacearchaeota archaeon]|nr:hypothetical protein [Candidatus Pacearchaeota archaeon]